MENVTISRELAQALVNYLAQRPYVEVMQLIPAILQAGQGAVESVQPVEEAEATSEE